MQSDSGFSSAHNSHGSLRTVPVVMDSSNTFSERFKTAPANQACAHAGSMAPVKLAMVSCGLGNVNRGFEVSTARWYSALKNDPRLDIRLFAGGNFPDSTWVANLPRDFLLRWPLFIASLFNKRRVWEFAYGSEMVTFAIGLLPHIFTYQPDVVWTKEAPFGYVLIFFRDLLRLKFKVVIANGGGFKPNTVKLFDYVQHLQPSSYEAALSFGIPKDKMQVLPHFARYVQPDKPRDEVRKEFGIEPDDFAVIAVSAWNCHHKRIDYIINEVARIDDPRVKLIMCGHPEPDTAYLKELGKRVLGDRIQWLTLPAEGVHRALYASDAYVIASIDEVFGAATIEAALAEKPIACHPNAGTNYILGDFVGNSDLTRDGELAARLTQIRVDPPTKERLKEIRDSVNSKFSEEVLCNRFADAVVGLKQRSL